MSISNYQEAVEFISSSDMISFEDSFDLSRLCSKFLRDKEKENQASVMSIVKSRIKCNSSDLI